MEHVNLGETLEQRLDIHKADHPLIILANDDSIEAPFGIVSTI